MREEEIQDYNLPEEPTEDIWTRNEMAKVIKSLLEDRKLEELFEETPLEDIGKVVTSKSLKLTFFDDSAVRALSQLFEAEVCRFMRTQPPNKLNGDTMRKLGSLRIAFLANIRRSLGTTMNKMNERSLLVAQWRISSSAPFGEEPRGGWLSRIRRWFK